MQSQQNGGDFGRPASSPPATPGGQPYGYPPGYPAGWQGQPTAVRPERPTSRRNFSAAMLLSIFVGFTGAHRLYVGKRVSGFTMMALTGTAAVLFTLGFMTIPEIVELERRGLVDSQDEMMAAALPMILKFAGGFMLFIAAALWSMIDTVLLACGAMKDPAGHVVRMVDPDAQAYGGQPSAKSDRSLAVTILLSFFLGGYGVHRFYAGRIASGVAMAILGGIGAVGIVSTSTLMNPGAGNQASPEMSAYFLLSCIPSAIAGVWAMVDVVMICLGKFRDADGRLIVRSK